MVVVCCGEIIGGEVDLLVAAETFIEDEGDGDRSKGDIFRSDDPFVKSEVVLWLLSLSRDDPVIDIEANASCCFRCCDAALKSVLR